SSSSSSTSATSSKPIPTASILSPWDFSYQPSPDGKDLNLLIMFHGLAAILQPRETTFPSQHRHSLPPSAPPVYDPQYNDLPSPDPAPTVPRLKRLLEALSKEGWAYNRIHLFGWGQGGTMALALAASVTDRLGSTVSVCGGPSSRPTGKLETPILYFHRLDARSAASEKTVSSLRNTFKEVEVLQGDIGRGKGDMPKSRSEWEGIMKFWSEVLSRDDRWKGEEVYEVVQ
ncbi:hypothetical protein P7C73_g6640, partial [Tremellales sp. Uapishka_1]